MKATTIDSQNFDNLVTNVPFAVVKYGATWCAACQELKPKFESVATHTDVPFYMVDVDESPELKDRARIKAIPMTLFYKNGKINQFIYGDVSEDQIKNKLRMLTS